jgi:hypothetical protein
MYHLATLLSSVRFCLRSGAKNAENAKGALSNEAALEKCKTFYHLGPISGKLLFAHALLGIFWMTLEF